MSHPPERPFRNQLDGFWSNFWNQPFSKLQHCLLFPDSTNAPLFSYFLGQPTVVESTATSSAAESSNSQDPSNSQSSDRGENHILYLPNTLPTPADKEAFFMSSAINSLESNSSPNLANGSTANTGNPVPLPLGYFVQNARVENANSEPQAANQEKTALNGIHRSAPGSQELAQLKAVLAEQSGTILALQARLSAQEGIIADCKGQIHALQETQRDSLLNQSNRMDSFEQTYQTDKIQTSRRLQASNQQLEAHLKEMVDAMLNAAVEKAIRLFKRNSKPTPTPARQSSTPCLDHLYETKVYRQKRTS